MNVIGFVGVDKHDIILYLAKVLEKAERKVLVIDNSETQAVNCSIYYPIDLDPNKNVIEYSGFSFLSKCELNLVNSIDVYDDVIIDFGYHVSHPDIKRCRFVNFVTDLQKHNAIRLKNVQMGEKVFINNSSIPVQKTLLIRNALDCKIKMDYVLELVKKLKFNDNDKFEIPIDEKDLIHQIHAQYNSVYSFKTLSDEFVDYLKTVLTKQFGLEENKLAKIYKTASGGDKR